MNNPTHVGNVTLVVSRLEDSKEPLILLGRKRPKNKKDSKRKRKRIGMGFWVPPGGASEQSDKSQKHAAQRELFQETGLLFPLKSFRKSGTLRGYMDSLETPRWLVHIYLIEADNTIVSDHKLSPNKEYSEMRWFKLSELPYERMLEGDREWIPRIVAGDILSIRIVTNDNADKTASISVVQVKAFN